MPKRSPKAGGELVPITLDDGVELDYCPVTKGIGFDAGEFSVLTLLAEDIPAFETAVSDAAETPYPSPMGTQNFKEVRFDPDHDVRIDVCLESGGIWLDRGELEKLQAIAAHLDSPQSRVLRAAQHLKEHGYDIVDARVRE
jgi:Zn-finger nucleic acid-binding protein